MEKRNTMLLTVIAVATLLVAVVGATFAYFSLSVSGSANSSKATVTTRSVGLVKITGTNDNLTLKVTPQDMANPASANEYYYAVVNSGSHSQTTGGIWEKQNDTSEAPEGTTATLANITRENGDENDTYTCGYKVTITPSSGTDLKKFAAGNLYLTITGDGLSESAAENSNPSNVSINDFSNFGESKELHGKVELSSNTEGLGDELVTATLYLVNKYNEVQSGFEGVDINLTFNVEPEGTCTIESASDVE